MQRKVTLESVNDQLLERLSILIENAEPEQLLDLTEALAKLNASYKGNQNFTAPETDTERIQREQQDVLIEALKNGPTCDIAEGEIV